MIRIILLFSLLSGGCSILRKKGDWGKHAFFPAKSERIREAFVKNVSSPHFYAPIATAGVINVMAWDNKISHWVNKERTLYNEQTEADNYSDNFNIVQKYEMYLSILLPPSQNEEGSAGNYLLNKLRGGALVSVASSASKISQHALRNQTERRRPNSADNNSMPSGHATEAGSRRVLIARNLQASGLPVGVQNGIDGANTLMSFAVMWARVEGKRHYPTDVLIGYSLGNFVSGFIYDSLINFDSDTTVGVAPLKGGGSANVTFSF